MKILSECLQNLSFTNHSNQSEDQQVISKLIEKFDKGIEMSMNKVNNMNFDPDSVSHIQL